MNRDEASTLLKIVSGVHLFFLGLAFLVLLVMAPIMFGMGAPRTMSILLLSLVGALMLLLAFMIAVLVGVFRHSPWARTPGIVVGALSVLSFPFGTVLGAIEIWLLGFDDAARSLFERRKAAPKHTKRPPRTRAT